MTRFDSLQEELKQTPATWLVTGGAGFIGSHLIQKLLELDQTVVGLDNLVTGHRHNLDEIETLVGPERWSKFSFHEGGIQSPDTCVAACSGVDYVLHQAALGSVPRSISDPLASHDANVTGFLNMLVAARDAGVKGFVYASSSSVYGDHPDLPKEEPKTGSVLSPYAATKKFNEIYAEVFGKCYDFSTIGLRYFNVFGPRQDPEGAYAAVIPKWVAAILNGEQVKIYGDGETSRDFCFVDNAVQANLLAATATKESAWNRVYNVAVGGQTSLNELYGFIEDGLMSRNPDLRKSKPGYTEFRPGDVRHSLANISAAEEQLGFEPSHSVSKGLDEALDWYLNDAVKKSS